MALFDCHGSHKHGLYSLLYKPLFYSLSHLDELWCAVSGCADPPRPRSSLSGGVCPLCPHLHFYWLPHSSSAGCRLSGNTVTQFRFCYRCHNTKTVLLQFTMTQWTLPSSLGQYNDPMNWVIVLTQFTPLSQYNEAFVMLHKPFLCRNCSVVWCIIVVCSNAYCCPRKVTGHLTHAGSDASSQGSVLGPLLFPLYMLPLQARYADDMQLYFLLTPLTFVNSKLCLLWCWME